MNRHATSTAAAAIVCVAGWLAPASVRGETIFSENFDGLKLGRSVHENIPGKNVWTKKPPADWQIDDRGISGVRDPKLGVAEWKGWSFVDPVWWWKTAGNQHRSRFKRGTGVVAVADPDEWSDRGNEKALKTYSTYLRTPEISLKGMQPDTATLLFDSSWRGDNRQTATVQVSFDGGDPVEVLHWGSQRGPDFKAERTNEQVTVTLKNPDDARQMVITFGLSDAGNDWWWAIDNVEVTATPLPPAMVAGSGWVWTLLVVLLVAGGAAFLILRRRRAGGSAQTPADALSLDEAAADRKEPVEEGAKQVTS